jgi:ATP-dependent protease HslVU (ClpYQ) peptidase subunit
MTTIAVNQDEIAWDSQITYGNVRSVMPNDKVTFAYGAIYACAGDAAACEALPTWHKRGAKIKSKPEGPWQMIVVTAKGCFYFTDDQPTGHKISIPFAIGSGQDFALSAMRSGKSPSDAVAIAADFDIYTGHPIKSVKIVPEMFKAPRRKTKAAASKKKPRRS